MITLQRSACFLKLFLMPFVCAVLFACDGGSGGNDTQNGNPDIYSGRSVWQGSDTSAWIVAIDEDGTIEGQGLAFNGTEFEISGNATPSGAVTFSAVGGTSIDVTYNGIIDTETQTVSGTFYDHEHDTDGTFDGKKQSTTKTFDFAEYHPLSLGTFWLYDIKKVTSEDWEKQEQIMLENIEMVNDVEAVQMGHYNPGNNAAFEYQLRSIGEDGIHIHAIVEIKGNSVDLSTFTPSITFPRQMKIGDVFSRTLTVTGLDQRTSSIDVEMIVMGEEDVSVVAKEFKNALKLILRLGSDYIVTWWAEGVGEIKSYDIEDGSSLYTISELNNYNIATKGAPVPAPEPVTSSSE